MIGSWSFLSAAAGLATIGGWVLGLTGASPRGPMLSSGRPSSVAEHRFAYDIEAKLQMALIEQPVLNVRFTNLGPETARSFNFQVLQYKWIVGNKSWSTTAVQLNSLTTVPVLQRNGMWQANYYPKVESGSKYQFKIVYSPTLYDSNRGNHNAVLTYSVP